VTVVALDLAGVELVSWRRAFAATGPTTPSTKGVAALVGKAVARVGALDREVLALTVGVPGPVDAAGNVPVLADLRRGLRDAQYDIKIDTIANLAVTAEHRSGEHAGTANLAYVSGDAGVTAGLIVDGHLLRGARGFTGRLGRILDVEERASIPAIVRAMLPDAEDDGPIVDYAPELERVVIAAKNGDTDALAEAGRHLGRGLAALADLLDPEVILLGGGYARLAEWLLPAAAEELDHTSLNISSLGPNAAALGGAMRALAEVEGGRLPALQATLAR
jgi:predicted NBD/HSP70 family sugar kinase